MKSKFLTILLLALVLVARPTQGASGTYPLPPIGNTQGYVDNLVGSYNALVDSSQPNFDNVKGHFSLYHAVGNIFKVIVLQTAKNVSGYVTLIFVPIGGNDPVVIMDQNETFDQQFPLSLPGENVTIENVTFDFSNTIIHVNLAYGISSSDITGDYLTNSANAARSLYRSDVTRIPQQTITSPVHSFWGDASNCIFAGACGVIGFLIGIVSGVWFLREKLHLTKAPTHEPKRRRRQSGEQRKLRTKALSVSLSSLFSVSFPSQ